MTGAGPDGATVPMPWGGVREALDWAGHAPQAFAGRRRPEVAALSGNPDKVPVSEDCLTLNLWTPGIGEGQAPGDGVVSRRCVLGWGRRTRHVPPELTWPAVVMSWS